MVGKQLSQQTQDFNIRYVQEKDYPYILQASEKIVEIVLPGTEFDEEKIKNIFSVALLNQTHAGIILADSEDKPRGFILVAVDELYFHPTLVAVCLSIWVEPECRGHSLDMLRALETWARYKKAEKVVLSSFINLSPKAFNKVLSRFNYKPQELVHWKDL